MKFKQKKYLNPLLVLISIITFTLSFYNNSWNIVDQEWFDNFQLDSEALVIGRLYVSEKKGLSHNNGLLCFIEECEIGKDWVKQNYHIYKNRIDVNLNLFTTYDSQIGGQGFILSFFNWISPFTNNTTLQLFYFINSFLLALVLTLFTIYINKSFGKLTALLTFLLLLFSPWLIVFAKNLYWFLWVFYTPFISLLYLTNKKQEYWEIKNSSLRLKRLDFLLFFLVLFKLFFNGFEYISTFLIMISTSIIFNGLKLSWSFKFLTRKIITTITSSLVAIVIYMCVLSYQLSFSLGSFQKGVNFLLNSFLRRSHGNSNSFDPVYKESLEVSIPYVIKKYLNNTAIDFNFSFETAWGNFKVINFFMIITIFFISSIYLITQQKKLKNKICKQRKSLSLVVTTWVSILAPLSWFIIFKGHSYIHNHMNFIVWYMPFCLFGYVIIGNSISLFLKEN